MRISSDPAAPSDDPAIAHQLLVPIAETDAIGSVQPLRRGASGRHRRPDALPCPASGFRPCSFLLAGVRLACLDVVLELLKVLSEDLSIVRISRDQAGKVVFLEAGNSRAGLQHVVERHGEDFARRGVEEAQIPDLLIDALTNGKVVGHQGSGTGRPIYEVVFEGQKHRVAVTVGDNGFVVGANPA